MKKGFCFVPEHEKLNKVITTRVNTKTKKLLMNVKTTVNHARALNNDTLLSTDAQFFFYLMSLGLDALKKKDLKPTV